MKAGFFPLPDELWLRCLIGVAVFCLVLQMLHTYVKFRWKRKLQDRELTLAAYEAAIRKRTMLLIFLSEMPVMLGFTLFVIQGNINATFGFGLVSMILYAQSHPRSMNPVTDQQ